MDFHEIWMEDGSGPGVEPVNFWCGSSLSLTLRDRASWSDCDSDGKKKESGVFRWLVCLSEYNLVLYFYECC